ncbi:MAG: hydroxyisourate hydrolase [Pyrinomonadaceae bacterium]
MSGITTHVLDTAIGKPAAGVSVMLERKSHSAGWEPLGESLTNVDGRITDLLPSGEVLLPGHYRLTFEVAPYFLLQDMESLYPRITIDFTVKDAEQHYHVPLLLSPFGYSTYRGS